jgi:hypothetical protein
MNKYPKCQVCGKRKRFTGQATARYCIDDYCQFKISFEPKEMVCNDCRCEYIDRAIAGACRVGD